MKLSFKIPSELFNDYNLAAAFIREKAKLQRLNPKLADYVRKSVAKKAQRANNRYNQSNDFGKSKLEKSLLSRIRGCVVGIFSSNYRTSQSNYGTNKVDVSYGNYSSGKCIYSSGKKWRIPNGEFHIKVCKGWLTKVYNKGIAELSGLLTTSAEEIPGHGDIRLFKATWIEQGKGFTLNNCSGYIAERYGIAYHANTAKLAIQGLKRKLALPNKKLTYSLNQILKKYGETTVNIADSEAVGNCESGTRSWCQAVGIDFSAGSAKLKDVIKGYELRPLKEALAVIRFVVSRQKEN